jgi:Concanavalin A-like lectin/glucanases superfamily/Putative phage tail protein
MAGGWVYGPTGHTAVDPSTGQYYHFQYFYDPLGNLKSWGWVLDTPAPSTSLASPVVSTVTGVNPTETSYSLYGHVVPLSVLGLARIGGEIIAGPWVDNGNATFCISFGVPADPSGTRSLREIAFDSEVVWTAADGFSAEGFTYRWYSGTLTQGADPQEIAHYGTEAVAYRPQMLLWFENLPLANTKFQKIPYVAALIADSVGDMINLGEGFSRLAYSPWVGYSSAQFETIGVSDACGGMIFAADADFLSTIQQFGRFYKSWDILQTDKLRIVDRGAVVTADINLDKTRLTGQVVLARAATTSVPRELELSTIDPGADYTIVPSKAVRPRVPVNVSSSVSSESVFVPMILDSSTRMSLVTYAKYQEEVARKKITGTAMMYGLQIEPGDLVAFLNLGDDFINEVFHIIETTHGQNYAVEFVAESILRCSLVVEDGIDPDWAYVVLLLGFEDLDGSTGAPGFTDESSRHQGTATVTGPQIDTAQFKFGASSALITGTLPLATFHGNSDFDLSNSNSDQFTIECWARFTSFSSYNTLVGKSLGNIEWLFAAFHGSLGTGGLTFQSTTTGLAIDVDVRSSDTVLSPGIWYHLAVDKDSTGKIRLYVNGTPVGSATPADSSINYNSLNNVIIGSTGFGGNPLNGWIDEVRITKGVARYKTDASFTSPTAAFPRGAPL